MARAIITPDGVFIEDGTDAFILPSGVFAEDQAAAPAGGRVMSSLAASGGLAGHGGIAGQGGGLAG